jgi:hypothetical protein
LRRNCAEYISRNNWGAKKEEYLVLVNSLFERKAGTPASPAKNEINAGNDVR